MKTLILGASGQVAKALQASLKARGREFLATSSKPGAEYSLDLGDIGSIERFFAEHGKKIPAKSEVYLPGAMTHVDRCETERDRCHKVNVEGPLRVGKLCAELGLKLCFYTSEYVFGQAEYEGGAKGPFAESDPPAPTSYYGACKLETETRLLEIPALHPLLIRTTMVFSYDPEGMNFFMQLYRHLSALERGEEVTAFRIPVDQISTPTYAPALAEASLELMEKGAEGVYHIVGRDLVSRREYLMKIVSAFGFTPARAERGFTFVRTAELGQAARRPLSAGLRVDKALAAGVRIWSLDEAFQEMARLSRRAL